MESKSPVVDDCFSECPLKEIFQGFKALVQKGKMMVQSKILLCEAMCAFMASKAAIDWTENVDDVLMFLTSLSDDKCHVMRYFISTNMLQQLPALNLSKMQKKLVVDSLLSSLGPCLSEGTQIQSLAERRCTALISFCVWSVTSPEDEIKCLNLVFEKGRKSEYVFIRRALSEVYSKMSSGPGWEVEEDAFSSFLQSLFSHTMVNFLDKDIPISSYPFGLFGFSSFQHFLNVHASVVFPIFVLKKGTDFVEKLCLDNGIELFQMVYSCFEFLIAYALPQYYGGNPKIADHVIKKWIPSIIGDKMPHLLSSRLNRILVFMLTSIYDKDGCFGAWPISQEPPYPHYPSKSIVKALEFLAKSISSKANLHTLFFSNRGLCPRVFVRFRN